MRPSPIGGGRILRRTLSVCLSVRLSVRPVMERHLAVVVIVTERHFAPPSELQWHTEGRITYGHLGRTNLFFYKTYREVWHKLARATYPFICFQIWKVSSYYLQNRQNYTGFSHSNINSCDVTKNVSTIQGSTNTVSVDTFLSIENAQNVFHHLHILCRAISKTWDSFVYWTLRNCPIYKRCTRNS